MFKYVTLLTGLLFSLSTTGAIVKVDGLNIEYSVRESTYNQWLDKLNLEIEIELVDGRLPNKEELQKVSETVLKSQPRAERRWVFFLLPMMESGAGAYATDHRIPQPEGLKIMEFMLINTPYNHLVK